MLDPSIALQAKAPDYQSPVAQYAKLLQLKDLMRSSQMGDLQYQQAQDTAARDKQFRDVLSNNDLNTPEGQAAAMRADPIKTQGIVKGQLEQEKLRNESLNLKGKTSRDEAATQQTRKQMQASEFTQHLQELARVSSPQDAQEWVKRGLQRGIGDVQTATDSLRNIPQDMAAFTQWRDREMMAGVKLEDQIKMNTPELKTVDLRGKQIVIDMNSRTRGNAPMSYATTATPGELLVDARGRAGQAQAERHFQAGQNKPQLHYDADRGAVIDLRSNSAQPVTIGGQPLGPKDKNLTEDQGKAASWLERMKMAEKIVLEAPDYAQKQTGTLGGAAAATLRSIPWVGQTGPAEAVANTVNNADRRKVEGAQEAWIAGLLRSDTGAAYKDMEKNDIKRTFFPQPGDDQENIDQKTVLRDGVYRAMQVRAGPGAARVEAIPKSDAAKAAAASSSPPVPVKSDADYNSLPKGTRFVTPDGKQGVKS